MSTAITSTVGRRVFARTLRHSRSSARSAAETAGARVRHARPLIAPSPCAIKRSQEHAGTSLSLFRPDHIDSFRLADARPWTPVQHGIVSQADLLHPDRRPPEWVPYKFRYGFRCDDDTCRSLDMGLRTGQPASPRVHPSRGADCSSWSVANHPGLFTDTVGFIEGYDRLSCPRVGFLGTLWRVTSWSKPSQEVDHDVDLADAGARQKRPSVFGDHLDHAGPGCSERAKRGLLVGGRELGAAHVQVDERHRDIGRFATGAERSRAFQEPARRYSSQCRFGVWRLA